MEMLGVDVRLIDWGRATTRTHVALLYVELQGWMTDASAKWARHATAMGELRHLELKDGSLVDLNTRSELRVSIGAKAGAKQP
jgi:ferric-dicitrate binding protein FerR (iron transport regulator)